MDTKAILVNKTAQIARYADDIDLIGRTVLRVKEEFNYLSEAVQEIGLRVNEEKTKLMHQTRKNRSRIGQNITLGDYNFEAVGTFKYLGSTLTARNEEDAEIQARIKCGNRAYFSLIKQLKSRTVHQKTKIRLYKTLIRTVVAYGCETWTLTQSAAEKIDRFERKILRRIFGPVRDGSIWRIRYNEELYRLYKEPKLSMHIRLMRLQWAGHIQRMPSERITQKILEQRMEGKRPIGKLRLR